MATMASTRSAGSCVTRNAFRKTSSVRGRSARRCFVAAQAGPGRASFTESVVGPALVACVSSFLVCQSAFARPEGVNRPDLLPKGEVTSVIDVAGFLTPSEEIRIKNEVASLEKDTGIKLRVLAQSYPETPGLAIRDYWKVDDNTIVFVADPTFGDILNFNVGIGVDLEVPRSFWGRLAGKYGNKFFWQEKGEAASIMNAVSAIDTCLREEPGKFKCSNVQGELGEEPSSGKFGSMFKF